MKQHEGKDDKGHLYMSLEKIAKFSLFSYQPIWFNNLQIVLSIVRRKEMKNFIQSHSTPSWWLQRVC